MVEGSRDESDQDNGAVGSSRHRCVGYDHRNQLGSRSVCNTDSGIAFSSDVTGGTTGSGGIT